VAALKAEVNATKTALATEVALKLGGGATVDATLPRFTGDVTCYVDDATGDVVGLQFGSSAPLCSTAGTPRTFAVPADGYVADVKVAVDKETGLLGELVFIVKSNSSLSPTAVFSCGTKGGLPVSVTPKASALSSVSAACKPVSQGRRLHQVSGLALDPASLSVVVTTVGAPAESGKSVPLVSCTRVVTSSITATPTFSSTVQLAVSLVGGGGGGAGLYTGSPSLSAVSGKMRENECTTGIR
jgi:hypothetical protein